MAVVDETIGRYQIIREVGRGGMGVVYEAHDPQLNRRVALKVLPQELSYDRRFVERFLREGRLAASLSHPNVVTVYEAGEAGGHYFLAMEYVAGTDLGHLIREKGSLDLDLALDILDQVAAGLDAAHVQGIVHRDVKPENVLLDVRGLAKVADFGIARAHEEAGGTRTGTVIGTAEYISPEQALGKPVDARSDIYSLACVAYEMLIGNPPFGRPTEDRTPISIITDHASRRPAEARSLNPRLRKGANYALIRALDKLPENRFATAHEFVEALRYGSAPLVSRRTLVLSSASTFAVGAGALLWNELRRLAMVQPGASSVKPPVRKTPVEALTFLKEGDLYLTVGREAPRRIAGGGIGAFAWSPDGTRIALAGSGLLILNVRDGGVERLNGTEEPDPSAGPPKPGANVWTENSVGYDWLTWLGPDTLGLSIIHHQTVHDKYSSTGQTFSCREINAYHITEKKTTPYPTLETLTRINSGQPTEHLQDAQFLVAHPSIPSLVAYAAKDERDPQHFRHSNVIGPDSDMRPDSIVIEDATKGKSYVRWIGIFESVEESRLSFALAWHPTRPVLAIGLRDRVLTCSDPDWEPVGFVQGWKEKSVHEEHGLRLGSTDGFYYPSWLPDGKSMWVNYQESEIYGNHVARHNDVRRVSYPDGKTEAVSNPGELTTWATVPGDLVLPSTFTVLPW